MFYPLRYMPSGHIFIDPQDDCDLVIDAMLETRYSREFCIAQAFEEGFVGRLMEAGFLVMSMELRDDEPKENNAEVQEPFFILLPELHLVRSALFFHDLHIKKSIRPFLSRYELRVDTDFDNVLGKCIKTHGDDWLTPPLAGVFQSLRVRKDMRVRPVSFSVYREGELKAGEVGVVIGRVYTSYSGYYEENNAGTVQMILMAQWLEKMGFDFLDFGMPLDYKTALGAQDISPEQFVRLFRAGRN